MKIYCKAFVAERYWDGIYGLDIVNYRLELVREVDRGPVEAGFHGTIPLMAFMGSDTDKALEKALMTRTVVSVTVEVK